MLLNGTSSKSVLSSATDKGLSTPVAIAVAFVRLHEAFFAVSDPENISRLRAQVQSKQLRHMMAYCMIDE